MNIAKRTVAFALVVLLLSITLFVQFSFQVSAQNRKGTVTADSLKIREQATTGSRHLGSIPGGNTVKIFGETTGQTITDGVSSNVWYKVTYGSVTGYVSAVYIKIIPQYTTDQAFENHISGFPESYKPYLRELHAQYPNWRFTPDNINMTLDEAVALEDTQKLTAYNVSWRSMGLGGYNWNKNEWVQSEEGYYIASREVVKYYMDPRSYLNSSSIFAFLPQNYDETNQTEEGIKKVIKGTFLADGYSDPKDTAYGGSYSKVLLEAAKSSGVNPYVLAATIIQEQGTGGTSPIISGKYSGYEGLYNFFNINAAGSTKHQIYVNGLIYARDKGWTTRSASIIGGALFCANNYIPVNQNTYYYMNFNVKNPSLVWHQYSQAVHDTNSKSIGVSKSYRDMTDAELNFLIPVYKNTSKESTKLPDKNGNMNNYYFTSISVSGLTPSFSMFNYNYDLNVWSDTNINLFVPEGANYIGAKSYQLGVGNNTVVLTVKSQSGYTNDYIINVRADRACTLYVNNPSVSSSSKITGDTNGDGKINGRDLANIQMHILGVRELGSEAMSSADTNYDGVINGRDLANVQMDILGIRKLN